MAALSAGYAVTASGTTLDRFCGGGITAVSLAAATIRSGMEDCVVAGGTEMMSYQQQLAADKAAAGMPPRIMGAGHAALDARHPQSNQGVRSEEHTSELQSLMRISYAAFCLKKKTIETTMTHIKQDTTI